MLFKSRHLKLAAASLCALALMATGCGGGSGYKDDLNSAESQFKKSQKSSTGKIRGAKTKQQYQDGVNELKSAIQTFEGKLRTLKPPAGARVAQARLVSALDALSRDLDAVLQALGAGSITKLQALQVNLQRDAQAVEGAGKELHSKGG